MKEKTFVSIDEAFNHGVMEGLKQALSECLEMVETDPQFLKAYLKARIAALKQVEDFMRNSNG